MTILALLGSLGAGGVRLRSRAITSEAVNDVTTFISITAANDGRLRIITGGPGDGQSTILDPELEWDGLGAVSALDSDDYEFRMDSISGNVFIDSEFEQGGIWYQGGGTWASSFSGSPSRAGVWRLQIRRASDQVVLASADYTLTLTCTGC